MPKDFISELRKCEVVGEDWGKWLLDTTGHYECPAVGARPRPARDRSSQCSSVDGGQELLTVHGYQGRESPLFREVVSDRLAMLPRMAQNLPAHKWH